MSAGRYNFEIEEGATFTRTITYTDNEDTAIDLAGSTVRMQIRDNYSAADAVISLSTPSTGITLSNETGKFTITMTATQTESLGIKQGVYDIEVEYDNGTVERILEGRVKISRQVTQ
jgi:hypothetical protein